MTQLCFGPAREGAEAGAMEGRRLLFGPAYASALPRRPVPGFEAALSYGAAFESGRMQFGPATAGEARPPAITIR